MEMQPADPPPFISMARWTVPATVTMVTLILTLVVWTSRRVDRAVPEPGWRAPAPPQKDTCQKNAQRREHSVTLGINEARFKNMDEPAQNAFPSIPEASAEKDQLPVGTKESIILGRV